MAEAWSRLAGPERPFFQPAFLKVLDADPALQRCYLVHEVQGRLVAAFAFQHGLLDGRQLGDFAPEQQEEARMAWPAWLLRLGRARLRDIRWPLAYLGTPLAPDDPGYALDERLEDGRRAWLADAFARIGRQWPDLRADLSLYQAELPAGFAALEAEPEFVLEIPDAWKTFDDYLSALQSKYRVHARRTLKASASLVRRELSLEAIASGEAQWEALYQNVASRAGFSLAKAGRGHFARMKAQYGPAFRFVAWYLADEQHPSSNEGAAPLQHPTVPALHGQPDDAAPGLDPGTCIGFQTALVESAASSKTLHARFIGLDYRHVRHYRLYQRMLYDYLCMAIDAQCARLDYGRTAAESKSVIGAKPQKTHFGFRYRNRLLNPVVGLMAAEARPPAWQARHPFKANSS
jgi:hypothetical protein